MHTSTIRRSIRRTLSVAAAAALALALIGPAPLASAQNRGIARACPDDAPDAFPDDDASVHHEAINCIAFYEITVGEDGQYKPSEEVSRAQMASFIAKTMEVAGYAFDEDPPDAFDDDEGSVHEANIDRLAAAGVVEGTGEREYSPTNPVTRAQMASFINKALGVVTGTQPTSDEDAFDDDNGSVHEDNINALAAIGVVEGTGEREYSPTRNVTRAPMASFIARGADYLAEQGHWPELPADGGTTFGVTPADEAALTANQTRSYTAEVESGTVVDLALFVTSNISTGTGDIRFADEDDDGRADLGTTAAQITQVDGVSVTAAQQVNDITSDGSITFVVRSSQDADVVPVVWADPSSSNGGNDALDLFETREASEAFGMGGRALYVPGEAAAGQTTPTARSTSTAQDLFVSTAAVTYYYDSNDTFQLQGEAITMADFEQMLSGGDAVAPNQGDILNVTYQPDEQFQSTFNLTQDSVKPPAAPEASVVIADEDETADDVEVTFAFPFDNGAGTTYDLQRRQTGLSCDQTTNTSWSTIAEDVQESPYLDKDLSDGCYEYRLLATSAVSGNTANGDTSEPVEIPGDSDSTAPSIDDARATTDNGEADSGDANGTVDDGDVHRFIFSEPMAASTATGTYQISDGDETLATINCGEGGNAMCSLNATPTVIGGTVYEPNRVLTVTLTATPSPTQAGSTAGVQYPASVRAVSAEWQDTSGNTLTFTGSDTVIQVAS